MIARSEVTESAVDLDNWSDQAHETMARISSKVLVNGELRASLSQEVIEVIHPADLSVIGHVPRCREADVDAAVNAAQRAFSSWRKVPARERGRMVQLAAEAVEKEAGLLAHILSLDTGNALRTNSRPEVAATIDLTRMYGGLAGELKGETYPSATPGVLQYTTRDPIGVVAGIIPWNLPMFLFVAKVAPALCAGNTIVVKSAECGKPLAEHKQVGKVTFTGSLPVGQTIAGYVAPKLCPVTLELGGKNPSIVMADADPDLAIPGIIEGMRYIRQGQGCTAATRVFVHESLYDRISDGVIDRLAKLKVGDPMIESTDIGSIISEDQFNRTLHYMEIAHNTPGARMLFGGKRPTEGYLGKGYFYPPTLIDGIPMESPICQDEVFGPVATMFPFTSFDDVIDLANDTPFGLAANLWTRDLSRAMEFAERIEAGYVQVNQCIAPRSNVSYGGIKMSGLGKEYALDSMIQHFCQSKTVMINRGTPGGNV
jgi:acyl-CoA reductase-like NAD-dependent aldehyde dehydrogenase